MSSTVLLTLKEAVEYSDVHGDALMRRAKNATMPAFTIGTGRRFCKSSTNNRTRKLEREQRRSTRKNASETRSERM